MRAVPIVSALVVAAVLCARPVARAGRRRRRRRRRVTPRRCARRSINCGETSKRGWRRWRPGSRRFRAEQPPPAAAAPAPACAGTAGGGGAARRGRRGRTERLAAGVRIRRRGLEGLQPRHGGHRRFPRRGRQQSGGARSRRSRSTSRRRRSRRSSIPYARADFFISFGEEGVERRRRIPDVHVAAGRAAHEGRQDARGVRQGELAAQPRAAVGRPAARDQEPGRRRGRHQRRRRLGGATDSRTPGCSSKRPARCSAATPATTFSSRASAAT